VNCEKFHHIPDKIKSSSSNNPYSIQDLTVSNFTKKVPAIKTPRLLRGSIGVKLIVVRRERKAIPRYVDDLITESDPRDAQHFWPDSIALAASAGSVFANSVCGHGCTIAIHEDTHLSISRLESSLSFVSAIFRIFLNLRILRSASYRERKSDIAVIYPSSDLKLDSANNNGRFYYVVQSHVGEYNTFCC